jgi:hypothetical protein
VTTNHGFFGWLAARFWQWRVLRSDKMRADFELLFPDVCMYCSYTRWANMERGQSLKLRRHDCKAGNSPPHPIPTARTVRR